MPDHPRGALVVWDVENAKPAWTIPEIFSLESGVLATAGNLVFYATLDGWLRAVDSRNGHILWEYKTNSQIVRRPITYAGPDSRQYVAVVAGLSSGAEVDDEDIDTRDLTAANGFANALPDLPRPTERTGRALRVRLAMRAAVCVALVPLLLMACEREQRSLRTPPPVAAALQDVRLMVNGIGGAPPSVLTNLGHPYENNALAYQLNQGKRLYSWFHCKGCHADGGGNLGPALMDGWWRYGPDPVGDTMTTDEVWQLTGYVRTIGAMSNAMIGDRIEAAGASARPHCRPFLTHSLWRRRNSWLPDH